MASERSTSAPRGQGRERSPRLSVEAERGELQQPVAGPGPTAFPAQAAKLVRPRWLTITPLGRAGGAGGVDHVGQVVGRPRAAVGRRSGLGARAGRPLAVDVETCTPAGGGRAPQVGPGQQDGGAGVLQHEGQPLGGVGGVEGHVGAARLEHPQQGHQQLRRALQADPHQHLGAHAPRPQAARPGPRPGVQLAVGEPAARRRARPGHRACGRPGRRRAGARRGRPGRGRPARSRPPAPPARPGAGAAPSHTAPPDPPPWPAARR